MCGFQMQYNVINIHNVRNEYADNNITLRRAMNDERVYMAIGYGLIDVNT